MSGLEVGALVVSILALFPPLQSLWNDWKASRRVKKSPEVEKVDQSLTLSRPVIEFEYDNHLRVLGRRFKVGDETAQLALSQIKLAQQDNLITVLKHALLSGGTHAGTLDLPSLHASSERVRRDTIRAMSDLHQRLAVKQMAGQKLPIPPPYEEVCWGGSTVDAGSSESSDDDDDDDGGCNAERYRKCPHAAGSGHGNLLETRCPRCKVQVEKEVPRALGYKIGNVYLTWGKVLMLAHLVCECYGSLSKGQLRYACIFCHCPKKSVFKPNEVWCQKGLHQHMSRQHRDRLC